MNHLIGEVLSDKFQYCLYTISVMIYSGYACESTDLDIAGLKLQFQAFLEYQRDLY